MPSYIIFHPDRQRQTIDVRADVLRNGAVEKDWVGRVLVDSINVGNEDPWCLSQPWMYSYCHATQVKRSRMGEGDIIFFVSGADADRELLRCDTVFVVEERLAWDNGKVPEQLADKYQEGSQEWKRHLKYGLPDEPGHTGKYTFTAKKYSDGIAVYSYLPLTSSGCNVGIPFGALGIAEKVRKKRKGKYPIELECGEATALYHSISRAAEIKVVCIQEVLSKTNDKVSVGCGRSSCC